MNSSIHDRETSAQRLDRVLDATPRKIEDIVKKAGLSYLETSRTLKRMFEKGEASRSEPDIHRAIPVHYWAK